MPKVIEKVNVDLGVVVEKIPLNFRNRTAFCEAMEEPPYWITELNRGKAVITPQKAARMCILLKTTPEEILLQEGATEEETAKCLEDIQRVKELVAELMAESEEKRSAKGEALSQVAQKLVKFASSASDEETAEVLRYIEYLESKRGGHEA